jgi:hypothetical protein
MIMLTLKILDSTHTPNLLNAFANLIFIFAARQGIGCTFLSNMIFKVTSSVSFLLRWVYGSEVQKAVPLCTTITKRTSIEGWGIRRIGLSGNNLI